MQNQTQNKTENTSQNDLKALEKKMKDAFKVGQYDQFGALAQQLKVIDPNNHLATKLTQKLDELKKRDEKKAQLAKVKEYEEMLKSLYKKKDFVKVKALASELKQFDPENRSADKWKSKVEKIENKPSSSGFFAQLFHSKSKLSDPASSQAPIATSQVSMPLLKPQPMAAENSIKTSVSPRVTTPLKGNTFTKMFGKAAPAPVDTKSVIDQIVAKTSQATNTTTQKGALSKPKKEKAHFNSVGFSKIFMNFTAVFVVFTAAFLYVEFLDRENRALGFIGISDNTGSKLHKAAEELTDRKRQEAILNKDIELYKAGYGDLALATVQSIVAQRIDWVNVFAKIEEVTESVFNLNKFFQYVQYDNYSFDAEKGTIRVTGTLTDPQGRNLTRLVELEDAFKYYPKDKNNPDDPTKPYFQGFRELTTLSKTLDEETGRYTSSFQLSFSLNK